MNWTRPKQQTCIFGLNGTLVNVQTRWTKIGPNEHEFKKVSKEKQLGFGSSLMKKKCIHDLGYGVDQVGFRWDEQGLLHQHFNSNVTWWWNATYDLD
jgi:hypothetical protein